MAKLSDLKKSKNSMWEDLQANLKTETEKGYTADERLWKPTVDKTGVAHPVP